eukprot:TRINITY_DN451_c0_g1_i1.p1 TRINITY_DN451_c0_g1~~TRINITY_DN451_c0_g1_i1.p1  ORF type:complete len:229 (+),score=33.30 TRINITY_DN451_c0_g1_i1:146-832(+)
MGAQGTKLARAAMADKEVKVVLVGMDDSGKTELMYKLTLEHSVSGIGKYKNMSVVDVTYLDYGGRGGGRFMRQMYYANTSGIVFLVETSNREHIDEAKTELDEILSEEKLMSVPLVVIAHNTKVGATDCMTVTEIQSKLALDNIPASRKWRIQEGADAQSVRDAMDWLSLAITGQLVTAALEAPEKPSIKLSSGDNVKKSPPELQKKKKSERSLRQAFAGLFRSSVAA